MPNYKEKLKKIIAFIPEFISLRLLRFALIYNIIFFGENHLRTKQVAYNIIGMTIFIILTLISRESAVACRVLVLGYGLMTIGGLTAISKSKMALIFTPISLLLVILFLKRNKKLMEEGSQ